MFSGKTALTTQSREVEDTLDRFWSARDGVGFCDCQRVVPPSQAVVKRIPPVNPHPHLQAAVVF